MLRLGEGMPPLVAVDAFAAFGSSQRDAPKPLRDTPAGRDTGAMRLDDVPVPATPAAQAALEVLSEYSPPALVNHCVRSYLLAASLAVLEQCDVDWELLYVASLLHDLGLEPDFDSHARPFEEAGGNVAWVFAAGAGWPRTRRARAAEIIVAHMRGADPAVDREGYLLDVATGLDISGRDVARWPREFLTELLAAHPRLDLGERFTACFAEQAARKPDSAAAAAVSSGIADRIATNPLESLL
jgi:hypothetical protein